MKKIFKIITNIINVFLVIFVLTFVLAVCLQRFSNNRISFFNYRMFTVVSGSMEPKYRVGDVLIAKDVAASDIKQGDVISYLGKAGYLTERVVTHQVVEIEKDNNGKYIFHTKGLANIVEDPIVREEQLYGVVVRKVYLLSFVYRSLRTPLGLFLMIGLPVMYIVGSEALIYMLEKEEEKRNKLKKKNKDVEEENNEDDYLEKETPKKKTTTKKSSTSKSSSSKSSSTTKKSSNTKSSRKKKSDNDK